MCGIAGMHGKRHPDMPSQLIQAIAHRGPDQPARYCHIESYSGAACRLSIVDVLGGEQPVLNQQKTICVSMNGEIYNYAVLREKLQRKGHYFTSSGDTEVILQAYEEYGIDFLAQLEGMYAIALYDARVDTLYLIRDSLGIKPLYYYLSTDVFAYSSEMKSFFASELSQGIVNDNYLLYRFIFGFGPASETLFTDIFPVMPGSYVSWCGGRAAVHHYQNTPLGWAIAHQLVAPNPIEEVARLLTSAIHAQLPTEVPWGIFLSGGVDSSILAYAAQQRTGVPPRLFTVSDESETNDLLSARSVARFLKAELVEFHLPVDTIIQLFPHFIASLEEFEPMNIFWYLLAHEARKHIKVALCGQGADEVFGGYPVYKDLSLLISTFSSRLAHVRSWCSAELIEQSETLLNRLMAPGGLEVFYDYFMSDQLVSFQLCPVDKCTMAHGVETRVPYLAERLVAFIRALPSEVRLGGEVEKQVLRAAFHTSNLPTLSRKKQFSGQQTLPLYHQRIHQLADTIVSDEQWNNHPYHFLFKSKAEMMSFDTLIHVLCRSKGKVPADFLSGHLYV